MEAVFASVPGYAQADFALRVEREGANGAGAAGRVFWGLPDNNYVDDEVHDFDVQPARDGTEDVSESAFVL